MAGLVIGTTDVPVGRLASRLDCNPQKEERSLSAPTYTGERMTTMNNEDPNVEAKGPSRLAGEGPA